MTPAIDLATKYKIAHSVHSYQHDPNTESYGEEAARLLNVKAAQIFKTLLVEFNTGELAVGVVPVSGKLNLKSIAKAAKVKKAIMADKQKVERSTGYVLGGVSPLGQKRALATFIDQSAKAFDTIFVSAGKRGLDIELRPSDLSRLTRGQFADISAA